MTRKNRFKAIPAVYAIFERGEEVLFMRRQNTGYQDGLLGLPSGHVEEGESFRSALIREVKEEVGVDIGRSALQLAHTMNRPDSLSPGESRIDLFYRINNWKGEAVNCEPHKCEGLIWQRPSDVSAEIIPEIAQVLELLQDGIIESEYGWDV